MPPRKGEVNFLLSRAWSNGSEDPHLAGVGARPCLARGRSSRRRRRVDQPGWKERGSGSACGAPTSSMRAGHAALPRIRRAAGLAAASAEGEHGGGVGARPCLARGRSSRRRRRVDQPGWKERGTGSACGAPTIVHAGRPCRHCRSRAISLRAAGLHLSRRFRGSANMP